MAKELLGMLSPEQRTALFLYNSPGRALISIAQQIVSVRKLPKEHWQGFRKGAGTGLLAAAKQSRELKCSSSSSSS